AVAPGLAVCIYIFYRDRHNQEPAFNMMLSFLFGVLAVIPAIFIENWADEYFDNSILSIIISSYLAVALVEEISKFLVLRYYSFTRSSFDEPLDGIVYAVLVSMGFATIENIFYAFKYGLSVAFVRMFTSVPAHATFAIIMGYFVGKAKFDATHKKNLFIKGIFGATMAHGTYDCFLFLNENEWLQTNVSEILFFAGALSSLYISIRLSRKLIRVHQLTSHHLFISKPALTIRKATAEDISLIRNLSLDVWPQTYSSILSPHQITYMLNLMYSEAALHKHMHENNDFLIIYNAGIPIGFASYGLLEHGIYKLHKIYILPKHQGRGTGKFVIDQIINDIKPKGATSLLLNVNRSNEAKSFYEKLGFVVIKTEDIDIGEGYFMNDFIMEKKLIQNTEPSINEDSS
ncbi:MAG TPA: GNAT family N-acetyltransferase, partial [Chitinophagaceae bacterium]|nr:GNAT family N-acetyltransferase [Chitinophagaceae bacterium]